MGARAYAQTSQQLQDSTQRLVGAKRVLRIGDDSASISIAAGLAARLSNQQAARQNTAQATSLLGTAQQGLSDIEAALSELGDVATAASSTGITEQQRSYYAARFAELRSIIDDSAATTQFNGTTLLDGSLDTSFDLGNGSQSAITVAIADSSSASLFAGATSSLATATDAAAAVVEVAAAANRFNAITADVDALAGRFSQADEAITRGQGGVRSAVTSLTQTDAAAESARRAIAQLRQDSAAHIVAQSARLNSNLLDLVNLPVAASTSSSSDTTSSSDATLETTSAQLASSTRSASQSASSSSAASTSGSASA